MIPKIEFESDTVTFLVTYNDGNKRNPRCRFSCCLKGIRKMKEMLVKRCFDIEGENILNYKVNISDNIRYGLGVISDKFMLVFSGE